MSTIDILSPAGDKAGTVELPAEIFDAKTSVPLIHQVVVAQLAAARQGTHKTKSRGEVRGGGRKPYRQKGTGRARQGSRRAPHFRGGGAVFGPHPRSYAQRLPRKMKRQALAVALKTKLDDGAIKVVDAFGLEAIKTRDLVGVLAALEASGRVLLVAPGADQLLRLSARNLPRVEVILADSINVVDLLKADIIVIEQPALARMEEVYR
jgi:large subunit ribosomal protein L4